MLSRSTRASTSLSYDQHWNSWGRWCLAQSPRGNSLVYAPTQVVAWFTSSQDLAFSTLRTTKSGLSSVFDVTHPDKLAIRKHHLVQRFFQAHKRLPRPPPAKPEGIWDVSVLLTHVLSLGPSASLDLDRLQDKAIILVSIATMWRPRSDVGRLQYRDVSLLRSTQHLVSGISLLVREPKEAAWKKTHLAPLPDCPELCPVGTLTFFLAQMHHFRPSLALDHSLFLTYLAHPTEHPHSIAPKTVAVRIQDAMHAAGTDQRFSAHSIRSASSTAAFQRGVPVSTIKLHANWSLASDTFEKYYLRPSDHLDKAASIMSKVLLASTDNITTSGVEAEASTVVVGTTHNRNDAEA